MIEITPEYLASQDLSPTIVERFWKYINKTDSCWLWTGMTDGKGYGKIVNRYTALTDNRIRVFAHRLSWIIHRGPIPSGLQVHHDCPGGDNPICVNPDHLWVGTQDENVRDMVNKNRAANGESIPTHKLTTEKVVQIRQRYVKQSREHGTVKLAKEFGVSAPAIRQIITRQTWKHV